MRPTGGDLASRCGPQTVPPLARAGGHDDPSRLVDRPGQKCMVIPTSLRSGEVTTNGWIP
jgi:hypothetical protein